MLLTLAGAQIVFATAPSATFDAPSSLLIGEVGTFTSTATDPDAGDSITQTEWDFENDGTFDATGTTVMHSYGSAGQRTVRMRVTDSNQEQSSAFKTVTVNNRPPTASFTASPNPAQPGETVNFNGSGSSDPDPGDVLSYAWDLDNDGQYDDGSDATASSSYPTPGTVTVKLRVTDVAGGQDVALKSITINSPPTASFTASPNPQVTGQPVNFNGSGSSDSDGSITAYAWDLDGDGFDDGTSATVSRSYSSTGNVTARLRVTDNTGATNIASRNVVIHTAPTASFTAIGTGLTTPEVPDVGETVNFDGSASHDNDPGGKIDKYEWDLDGNGSFETDTGATPTTSRSYDSAGTRNVQLRVTDNQGGTAVATKPLRINALPVASLIFTIPNLPSGQDPQVPLLGQPVQFVSTSTDAESTNPPANNNSIATYLWDLDGDPQTGPGGFETNTSNSATPAVPPPIAFATPGTKTIRLIVIDKDGGVSVPVGEKTLRVNRPPVSDFTFDKQTPVTNELITFNEAATDPDNDPLTYAWDLDGDGTFGEKVPAQNLDENGERVTWSFGSKGDKTVKLRVTDTGGASHVAARTLRVEDTRPNADFGYSPNFPLPGQDVTFTSNSSPTAGQQIAKQEWDFSFDPRFDPMKDTFGADAEGPVANHAFATAGPKLVAIKVTEAGGGYDIETRTVIVNAPPSASFNAAPSTPVTDDVVTLTSTSSDPDGPVTLAWDTDNDGEFDDATGAVATRKFTAVGSYTIRLRVTDDRGASAIASGIVNVAKRPGPPLIDARVQIAGRTTEKGARLSLLRVRGPVGMLVRLKCKGKDCPMRSKRVKPKQGTVRFKKLERNLRAGTKIVIKATLDGFVGKRVVFKIRKGKSPRRTDGCLDMATGKRGACP